MEVLTGGKPTLKYASCGGAVIFLGRLIVLVRPKVRLEQSTFPDEWLLPKGHIEQGETSKEAAQREATEETGAVISKVEEIPILITENLVEEFSEVQTVTWFAMRAACLLTEKQTDEREVGLFDPLVALAKLTYPDQRKVLCSVISGGEAD